MVSQWSGLKVFKGFLSDCLFCLFGFAMMKIIIKKDKTLEWKRQRRKRSWEELQEGEGEKNRGEADGLIERWRERNRRRICFNTCQKNPKTQKPWQQLTYE